MNDDLRHDLASTNRDDMTDEIPESAETAEIRVGIEQTRNEMSETIDAIQARLNPDHLKEQVKEQVREQFQEVKSTVRDATIGKAEQMARNVGESVSDARYTVMETISHNPIPAAMVALGLGWLWMNRRSGQRHRYAQYGNPRQYPVDQPYYRGQQYYGGARFYDDRPTYGGVDQGDYGRGGVVEQGRQAVGSTVNRVQETAGHVASRARDAVEGTVHGVQETASTIASRTQETVGNIADRSQQTVGHLVDQVQETAGTVAHQAQYQAQRLEDRFQQALRDNPLAVGAVAVALGTAVGFAIPETRREHELMGEARDTLVEKVQTAVQETVEKVQQVAGDVVEGAQTTVQESAKEQGLTS